MISIRAIIFFMLPLLISGKGIGPGEQDFGYVNVREGAHMFWWLYHTTANVTDSAERPLILWLMGGPGGSSTGTANFWFVGPVNERLEPRESTWVKDYNILFVDCPVGAGFSYVDELRYLSSTNDEIANDLFQVTKSVLNQLPKFKATPFYIYGISYGGKMATDLALKLHQEIQLGNIECNLQGVSMGNPWISPVDSSVAYAETLYQFSLLDKNQRDQVYRQGQYLKQAFDNGDYFRTRVEWDRIMDLIYSLTDGVDFYNLANKVEKLPEKVKSFDRMMSEKLSYQMDYWELFNFLNETVREECNIPDNVIWGSLVSDLQLYLYVDFMMPVTDSIERLLNETNIDIHVGSGNLDLIVSTTGTLQWIDNLSWPNKQEYEDAPRITVWVNDTMEGYKKEGGNMHFYWFNVAGHSTIDENKPMTAAFLQSVTGV